VYGHCNAFDTVASDALCEAEIVGGFGCCLHIAYAAVDARLGLARVNCTLCNFPCLDSSARVV
jgi:hypothetical protein